MNTYSDFEYTGIGELKSEKEGVFSGVDFSVRLLDNGSIKGSFRVKLDKMFSFLTNVNHFDISGKIKSKYRESKETAYKEHAILVINCQETTHSRDREVNGTEVLIVKFYAEKLTIDFGKIESRENSLIVYYGSVGSSGLRTFFNLRPIILDTPQARLSVFDLKGPEDDSCGYFDLYKELNISHINSCIIIEYKDLNYIDVEDILSKSHDFVERILCLCSYAQGSFHQWSFVQIYEVSNNLRYLRYVEIRLTSPRTVKKFPIIKGNIDSYLLSSLQTYPKEQNLREGLLFALDWYVESINGDVFEFKYINACTCLELLVSIFTDDSKNAGLIKDSKFDGLRKKIKNLIDEYFLEKTIDSEVKIKMNDKIIELNREPAKYKILRIIDKFGINFQFKGMESQELVLNILKIRNRIVHQGLYKPSKSDPDLFENYKFLLHLIIRLFLSIVGYKQNYWLPYEYEKSIPFQEWSNCHQELREN